MDRVGVEPTTSAMPMPTRKVETAAHIVRSVAGSNPTLALMLETGINHTKRTAITVMESICEPLKGKTSPR